MSDKTTILRAFNNHFFEFIDDIIRIFPENSDLEVSKTSFQTIKQANPTAIIKSWFLFVYKPYSSVIDAGDITFFFDKDYSADLSNLSNSQSIMGIIDSFRQPVKSMSDANKVHATKYIQNLSKLSKLYSEM
uniref:Uncharacterized protein n=1 Tax=viral metagenome TaxID=1070528 RepID=A0A6C0DPX3_9ZZZZ